MTSDIGFRPDLRVEKKILRQGCLRLAAMDEVGRGALAGPVSVGVVVVDSDIGRVPAGLRDSKLLRPAVRQALVPAIRRWAVEFAVGHASSVEIDQIGIIRALRLAGQRALNALVEPVDAVLLDGNHDYLNEPGVDVGLRIVHTRIKADLTCAAVAGASVLAKTERDAHLVMISDDHPEYLFAVNKGYGTPEHLAVLRRIGPSAVHRQSWRLPAMAVDGMSEGGE